MTGTTDPLLLDLIEWIAQEPRLYADVMQAWRTSCPRLTIWEDAIEKGLICRATSDGCDSMVIATEAGIRLLRERGRATSL